MQFLVTLVQLSFLLRVIWQNVEGLAKKPTSGTLDTIWEVTGTKLPVLPVPSGHPVSKQNADATSCISLLGCNTTSRYCKQEHGTKETQTLRLYPGGNHYYVSTADQEIQGRTQRR